MARPKAPYGIDVHTLALAKLFASADVTVDFDLTFLVQFVLFTTFVLVMKPMLFDPLMRVFEERELRTEGAKKEARVMDAQAGELVTRYEAELEKVRHSAGLEREKLRAETAKLEGAERLKAFAWLAGYAAHMITDVTVDRDLETLGEALAGQLFSDDAPMKTFFTQRLLIVPDDWFGYLSRRGLEVRARVKMDPQTGTAASSGPWKEEYLPTESLLFGLMVGRRTVQLKEGPGKGDPSRSNQRQDQQQPDEKPEPVEPHKPSDYLTELLQDARVLRLGGKSSVGGGRVRFTLFT